MDKKKIRRTVLGIVFLLLAVIVCTWILRSAQAEQRERDASGTLTGVNPFGRQEFSDRTPSMETATGELEISNTIDGYTSDVENMVKERIAEAYEVYRSYELTYDRESDRLYYNGELVGYFEDKQIKHFFGPYEDSPIKIVAVRDENGILSGLDVDGIP